MLLGVDDSNLERVDVIKYFIQQAMNNNNNICFYNISKISKTEHVYIIFKTNGFAQSFLLLER